MNGEAVGAIAAIVGALITGGFGTYGLVYNVRSQRRTAREDRLARQPGEEVKALQEEIARLRKDLEEADETVARLRATHQKLIGDTDQYIEDARRARANEYALQVKFEKLKRSTSKAGDGEV